jgi:acyl carrier protein/nodulation protein F
MAKVAEQIIGILKKNMPKPLKSITPDTLIKELEIESLDLAVIVFDIEDTFGIEIPYNANEDVEAFSTVGSIATKVESLIAESQAAA